MPRARGGLHGLLRRVWWLVPRGVCGVEKEASRQVGEVHVPQMRPSWYKEAARTRYGAFSIHFSFFFSTLFFLFFFLSVIFFSFVLFGCSFCFSHDYYSILLRETLRNVRKLRLFIVERNKRNWEKKKKEERERESWCIIYEQRHPQFLADVDAQSRKRSMMKKNMISKMMR